jgi:hypothetical protein
MLDIGGDFVAARWHRNEEVLELVRDPLGSRTIYYTELSGGGIAFSTRATSLASLPEVCSEPDAETLIEHLTYLSPRSGASCFKAIREVPRSSRLLWSNARGIRVTRYWNLVADEVGSDVERRMLLRERFVKSVRRACAGSMQPAVALSGGVDSSAIFRTALQVNPAVMAVNHQSSAFRESDEREFLECALAGHIGKLVQFEFRCPEDVRPIIATAQDPAYVTFAIGAWMNGSHALAAGADRLLYGAHGDQFAGNVSDLPLEFAYRRQWRKLWTHQLKATTGLRLRCIASSSLRVTVPSLSVRSRLRSSFARTNAVLMRHIDREFVERLGLQERWGSQLAAISSPTDDFTVSLDTFIDALAPKETGAIRCAGDAGGVPIAMPFLDPWIARSCAGLLLDDRKNCGRDRAAFRSAMADVLPDPIARRTSKAKFTQLWHSTWSRVREQLASEVSLERIGQVLKITNLNGITRELLDCGLPGAKVLTDLWLCSAWLDSHCG